MLCLLFMSQGIQYFLLFLFTSLFSDFCRLVVFFRTELRRKHYHITEKNIITSHYRGNNYTKIICVITLQQKLVHTIENKIVVIMT